MSFTCFFNADIENDGVLTVSGKKLFDILKELPNSSIINFEYSGTRLNITSGNTNFELSTIDSNSFPVIPDIQPEHYLKIDANNFLDSLKKIQFCVLNDAQKQEYTGIGLQIEGDKLELFATGMQRVGTASIKINSEYSNDFIINIPKKTINELIKTFEGKEIIEIETDKKQIVFKVNNMTIYSKLIEKTIKGVKSLFTSEYPIVANVNKNLFLEASRRISAIVSENLPSIKLTFTKDSLNLSSTNTEYGQGNETIDIIDFNHDEEFDLSLNVKHINEIIQAITTETFSFHIKDKRSPILIIPDDNIYKYLAVPLSV